MVFILLIEHISCRPEPTCNRTWDGWLCWDDTRAGVVSEQHCPDYFQDFDPSGMIYGAFVKKKKEKKNCQHLLSFNPVVYFTYSQSLDNVDQIHPPGFMFVPLPTEMVTKVCTDGGYWFQHPESNRTWTNYTRCNEHTNEGRMVGVYGMLIT